MVTKAEIATIRKILYEYITLCDNTGQEYEAQEAREALDILDSLKPATTDDVLGTLENYEQEEMSDDNY